MPVQRKVKEFTIFTRCARKVNSTVDGTGTTVSSFVFPVGVITTYGTGNVVAGTLDGDSKDYWRLVDEVDSIKEAKLKVSKLQAEGYPLPMIKIGRTVTMHVELEF